MIKIKTNQALKTLKGEELKEGNETITVGLLMANILSGQVSNPHRAYQFAKKFSVEKEVELKAEDQVYLKQQVESAKHLGAIYIGQLIEILEGSESK